MTLSREHSFMVLRILCFACMVGCLLCVGCEAAPPASVADPFGPAFTPTSIGRWTAHWERGGIYLDFDGIPLLRGGIVQVFTPDFARGYYGSGSVPSPATLEALPDGGRAYVALFHYTHDGRRFDATQRVEVHPDNTVRFAIRTAWQANEPALMEWNPVRVWAYPLLGAQCRIVTTDGKTQAGTIGLRPNGKEASSKKPTAFPSTQASPGWTQAIFDSTRVGTLTFSTTTADAATNGSDAPTLFDAREDGYLRDEKLFWIGYGTAPLAPGQETERSLTLVVTPATVAPPAPAQTAANAAPAEAETELRSISNAQSPLPPLDDANGSPIIIPRPRSVTFSRSTTGDFIVGKKLDVFLNLQKAPGRERIGLDVQRLLVSHFALPSAARLLKVLNDGPFTAPSRTRHRQHAPRSHSAQNAERIRMARLHRVIPADVLETFPSLTVEIKPVPAKPEGYILRVNRHTITVTGNSEAGAFYGLQTLRQLWRVRPDGKRVFRGCQIVDEPRLKFRGAHIFVGKNALTFHKKLIERLFARFKMNALIMECEYTKWKSHPEIHVPYAMPPDDLRRDVQFARDHFLEPIPLVNTLGHSQWMFANGQHLDLAEDRRAPYAYDASNPKTYAFVFDIMKETLSIFENPARFHIGHDEVKIPGNAEFGQYPARPENIRKGVTRLFVDDTEKLSAWLKQHHAKTMLWADMLLHPSEGANVPGQPELTAANAVTLAEARERRAALPSGLVACDWRYAAGSEQRNGLDALHSAGFGTIGCAWYEPENIRGWARQAIAHGALGTLQTTWAGYDSEETLLDGPEFKQFTAYILAAEYAWSGTDLHPRAEKTAENALAGVPDAPKPLPYTAADVFARLWHEEDSDGKPRAGWTLRPARPNFQLTGTTNNGLPWHALVSAEDLAPTSTCVTDSVTGVVLPATDFGLMLHSQLPPSTEDGKPASFPVAVTLPINRKAAVLAFQQATAYGVAAETPVATYTVYYADGGQTKIPLRYGRELRALDDDAPADTLHATPLSARDNSRTALTRRLFQWKNPRPNATIARIVFRADNAVAAPILFSITGRE